MALTRDDILKADDLGLLKLRVPEWGDDVYIRVMTVGERDAYENEFLQAKNKNCGVDNFRAKFLQRVLCDEKGHLLFGPEEVALLAGKSARVMSRLWEAAMKHNALSDEDVEELAKN
jgi:hypothetical protein